MRRGSALIAKHLHLFQGEYAEKPKSTHAGFVGQVNSREASARTGRREATPAVVAVAGGNNFVIRYLLYLAKEALIPAIGCMEVNSRLSSDDLIVTVGEYD